jgi:hypothetical protein
MMSSSSTLKSVRAATLEVQEFLRREQGAGNRQPDLTQYYPQIMSLSACLQEVGQRLQGSAAAGIENPELSVYACRLRELRDALHSITERLVKRRSELERERNRLRGVSRWVAAARDTESGSRS